MSLPTNYFLDSLGWCLGLVPAYLLVSTTRGAALPQTLLVALIRHESNALGFVVTMVINGGSTAVVAVSGDISGCSSGSGSATWVMVMMCDRKKLVGFFCSYKCSVANE